MDPATSDSVQIQARLREILEPRHEILEAYVFGSVSRGNAQSHSDLDVAVFIDAT